MIACTPSVSPRCASISSTTDIGIRRPAPGRRDHRPVQPAARGRNRPGVSTKTICACPSIATPRMRVRVVCTLWVTIETLAPTIRFSSVDLPAFGSPIRATKPAAGPACCLGHPAASIRASKRLCRRLFGLPFRARPGAFRRAVRQPHLDGEHRLVVRALAALFDHRPAAAGRGPAPIPAARSWRRGRPPRTAADPAAPQPQDQRPRRLEPGVEIDGGDHRLHRVAQQRLLAPPARHHLGPAQLQHLAQARSRGPRRRRSPCAPAR